MNVIISNWRASLDNLLFHHDIQQRCCALNRFITECTFAGSDKCSGECFQMNQIIFSFCQF